MDCSPQWGWGVGDNYGGPLALLTQPLRGLVGDTNGGGKKTPSPTSKFCIRYAGDKSHNRMMLYKADVCPPPDYYDPAVGGGSEVWMHTADLPTEWDKYASSGMVMHCYRYIQTIWGVATKFYRSPNTWSTATWTTNPCLCTSALQNQGNCTIHSTYGAGGAVWIYEGKQHLRMLSTMLVPAINHCAPQQFVFRRISSLL